MSRDRTNTSPRALESQDILPLSPDHGIYPSVDSEAAKRSIFSYIFNSKAPAPAPARIRPKISRKRNPSRRRSFESISEMHSVSNRQSLSTPFSQGYRRELARKCRVSWRTIRTPAVELKRRDSLASSRSLDGVVFQKATRDEQREIILRYLSRHEDGRDYGEGLTARLSDEDQAAILVDIADERQATGQLIFNRFERLCILNVLQCQHRIVVIDEQIQFGEEEQRVANVDLVHRAMNRYVEAIEAYQKLSNLKQPGFQTSNLSGRALALALHEPRYWDSPDALNVFDLAPSKQDHSVDRIRLWLQRVVPNSFLDIWGKERREIDVAAAKLPTAKTKHNIDVYNGHILDDIGSKEAKKIIASYHQRPHHISPVVDITTRVLVAIIGGLLVLVPMTILSYITDFRWILFVTFAFTILFSVGLSIMSRASNDQIIMATAAYGAVLVVFVGNFLTKKEV